MNRRSACLLLASGPALAANWLTQKTEDRERAWIGPEFWSNPLQDWRFRNGRLECFVSGGNRTVYLLTRELSEKTGNFAMQVELGRIEDDSTPLDEGFAGFRLGIKGRYNDYRDSAIYGTGLNAGVTAAGQLFIGEIRGTPSSVAGFPRPIRLTFEAQQRSSGYELRLSALDETDRVLAGISRTDVPASWVTGGLALVCSAGPIGESPDPSSIRTTMSGMNIANSERHGNWRFWFRNWNVSGDKIEHHQERSFGPILWTMYTVSKGVLKLTAQMVPVDDRTEPVRLQIKRNGQWRTVGSSAIDPLARTAVFRIAPWPEDQDTLYRVVYEWHGTNTFEGTIRRNPAGKSKIVLAALSCLNDFGFPNADLLASVQKFKPDLVAFQGDQIYERNGGYGIQRGPLEPAVLDYLRKWYLFGWSFRDIMRDTPSICTPDDHDLFQGNVWGAGGRHADGFGDPGQDSGGYVEPATWVNMMQRTQTSHLPDPFDPTPVQQNIGVYYTALSWGGISFAILEDRKWKSAPKVKLPFARIVNGWAQNPAYVASRDGDVPGAELLGPRQLKFLDEWAQDWSAKTWMKVALSQTLFANVATLPPPANNDDVTPQLPILRPGDYAAGEVLVADHDSNGWPQSGRNRALQAWRKCAAIHVCGDQHLGSTVQYGVKDWGDAAYGVCSPALSNIFPRRWFPPHPGNNALSSSSKNTDDYLDGFGNKVTVHAVFNPEQMDPDPNPLMDRSPGFAILEFDRDERTIAITVWPRRGGAEEKQPVAGWPIKIHQLDNGWSRTEWILDPVHAEGLQDFCVQVLDEASHEIIYTLRIKGASFAPPVRNRGKYSVRVFDPDGTYERWYRDLDAKPKKRPA